MKFTPRRATENLSRPQSLLYQRQLLAVVSLLIGGMAVLLAATTHAPVMSALMVFEMCGQYALLPMLLPACVLATLVASRLEPVSIYGLRGPGDAAPGRG